MCFDFAVKNFENSLYCIRCRCDDVFDVSFTNLEIYLFEYFGCVIHVLLLRVFQLASF